jgi:transcriptional regulator with XRE-family HTH domain
MTMKAKRPATLTDQVRHIVETCGQTRYAISKATGISQASLSKLASGERFLSPGALDTLGAYLGLRIVVDEPKTKKGGK